jgi:hypothetical protein
LSISQTTILKAAGSLNAVAKGRLEHFDLAIEEQPLMD